MSSSALSITSGKAVLVTDHPVVAENALDVKHLVGGIDVEVDLLVDVGFIVLFPDDIQLLMFHFVLLFDFGHKESRKSVYGFPAQCFFCEDSDY